MKKNISKSISKIGMYGCWIAIIFISLVYVISSSGPWDKYIFNSVKIPKIDPTVHLDTQFYVLPSKIYGNSRAGIPRNEMLIEKSRNFYSGIGTEFHASTFYRPDFQQFPLETLLILFFRLTTFIGLVSFLYLLYLILRSVYEENPFDLRNHHRLFYMGLIAIILPIIITLHSTVLAAFVQYDPRLLEYEISPSYLSLWLIFGGVLLLILSFLFKEMVRIHEEQKLTV